MLDIPVTVVKIMKVTINRGPALVHILI